MTSVEFIYEQVSTIVQFQPEDKMKALFQKFEGKSRIPLKTVFFVCGGDIVNSESTFSEISKSKDNIKVLVYKAYNPDNPEIQNEQTNLNESITKPKFIMCPVCNENIRYKLNNYKINLYECRNGHNIDNILLNEFEDKQKYDMSKIICQECNKNNKKKASFNEFYKCLSCNKYICPLCKTIHDKTHNIINMDKNYICSIHNEPYSKYCIDCKTNVCLACSNEHKNHNGINYDAIMPDLNEINNKMKELRENINIFEENINNIIKKLNNC